MTDYSGFCRFVALETEEKYGDAPVIARMISKMVNSRRLVRDGDVLRPCEWGDFCILLRGRKGFSAYAAELEKQGIPVYADVSENLLEAPQVQPLAAIWWRCVRKPHAGACMVRWPQAKTKKCSSSAKGCACCAVRPAP